MDPNHSPDGFLTAVRVRRVYSDCYRDEHVTVKVAKLEGWLVRHTLSDLRLYAHREEIIRMLLALPKGARVDERGGASVLTLTFRDDETRWTDDPSDVEKLVALGLASGLVSFCAPRDKWPKLPGGMPYVRIEITRHGVKLN